MLRLSVILCGSENLLSVLFSPFLFPFSQRNIIFLHFTMLMAQGFTISYGHGPNLCSQDTLLCFCTAWLMTLCFSLEEERDLILFWTFPFCGIKGTNEAKYQKWGYLLKEKEGEEKREEEQERGYITISRRLMLPKSKSFSACVVWWCFQCVLSSMEFLLLSRYCFRYVQVLSPGNLPVCYLCAYKGPALEGSHHLLLCLLPAHRHK